jgi:uncharacterized membrane protein
METILFIGLFILVLVLNRTQLRELRAEVADLRERLRQLLNVLEKQGTITFTEQAKPKQSVAPETVVMESTAAVVQPPKAKTTKVAVAASQPVEQAKPVSYEQQFGARLPVWIGGVALALAGFFMVKYSIETGLLSPLVRIVLGVLFGAGLLFAAEWVRSKPDFDNGTRISQALSGAGIADLYLCIFAATSLYELIPAAIGFIGLAGVTALAVLLSLRHGVPIALLGMVGGFLTPAMVSSNNPSAPLLFIYLYFVLGGFMVVIRKQMWWWMAIPTVLGSFLWVGLWLFGGHFTPGDSLWLGMFLLAISATVVYTSHQEYEHETVAAQSPVTLSSGLSYLTLAGAILLMGIVAVSGGLGLQQWGMFALLSLGGIGLAHFNQRLYGLVPWISMGVNGVMLCIWYTPDTALWALITALFGATYMASGYLLQSRSERPLIWAGLTAAAALGYYLLGYYTIHTTGLVAGIPVFWGMLALALAGLGVYALQDIMAQVPEDHPQKQHLMAIYASMSTAFLSLTFTIELPREFLSVAFAEQTLALAWINTRVSINALRYLTGLLAIVFAGLLMPQIVLLIQIAIFSLFEVQLGVQSSVPILDWPLFQLGVPALCFGAASYLLRQTKDDRLVQGIELGAMAMIAVMGYYLIHQAFHEHENVLFVTANFFERGVITNILFLYGLGAMLVGQRFSRSAVSLGGLVLFGMAAFRIIYFDLFLENPRWSQEEVGSLPILNSLLLTYALPIVWTWLALPLVRQNLVQKFSYGFMMLLSFSWLSLNVRQLFQGNLLNGHTITNGEIYAYSAAWLLFGVGLLILGTWRRDKMIRLASLGVMVLTIGKVFLYDASALEGLLRVFSFFALGLSLLGLSWFYTRFVFDQKDSADKS